MRKVHKPVCDIRVATSHIFYTVYDLKPTSFRSSHWKATLTKGHSPSKKVWTAGQQGIMDGHSRWQAGSKNRKKRKTLEIEFLYVTKSISNALKKRLWTSAISTPPAEEDQRLQKLPQHLLNTSLRSWWCGLLKSQKQDALAVNQFCCFQILLVL